MTVRFSVTVRQVREDGSEAPLDEELAAALAAPAEQFAGLAAWAADEARFCDHGEREKVIGQEGRELQRRLLQATFDIDSAREERASGVTSAAGIPHGSVEEDHGRGLASVFGPVRVTRMRTRRRPSHTRTGWASCTATSSRRTSSPTAAGRCSPTSASPPASGARPAGTH